MLKKIIDFIKTELKWRQMRREQSRKAVRNAVHTVLTGGLPRVKI